MGWFGREVVLYQIKYSKKIFENLEQKIASPILISTGSHFEKYIIGIDDELEKYLKMEKNILTRESFHGNYNDSRWCEHQIELNKVGNENSDDENAYNCSGSKDGGKDEGEDENEEDPMVGLVNIHRYGDGEREDVLIVDDIEYNIEDLCDMRQLLDSDSDSDDNSKKISKKDDNKRIRRNSSCDTSFLFFYKKNIIYDVRSEHWFDDE